MILFATSVRLAVSWTIIVNSCSAHIAFLKFYSLFMLLFRNHILAFSSVRIIRCSGLPILILFIKASSIPRIPVNIAPFSNTLSNIANRISAYNKTALQKSVSSKSPATKLASDRFALINTVLIHSLSASLAALILAFVKSAYEKLDLPKSAPSKFVDIKVDEHSEDEERSLLFKSMPSKIQSVIFAWSSG